MKRESLPNYLSNIFNYPIKRFATREVRIGNVLLGSKHPIRIQSMTTTDTIDTHETVKQCMALFDHGADIVRITAPGPKDAENLANIKTELLKRNYTGPLVADIHFSPKAALIACEHVEKVRINPGNFVDRKRFQVHTYSDAEYEEELEEVKVAFLPLVKRAKELKRVLRIGSNHGSLSDRIMNRYGDTPLGMVESALEFIRIAHKENFYDIVVSMKSSNPQVMVQAYRLLVAYFLKENIDSPIHLGVTEAGMGRDGRMKSAVGIGTLLRDGIGDTIRVSLTENPIQEIPAARNILKTLKLYTNSRGEDKVKEEEEIKKKNIKKFMQIKNIFLNKPNSSLKHESLLSFYKKNELLNREKQYSKIINPFTYNRLPSKEICIDFHNQDNTSKETCFSLGAKEKQKTILDLNTFKDADSMELGVLKERGLDMVVYDATTNPILIRTALELKIPTIFDYGYLLKNFHSQSEKKFSSIKPILLNSLYKNTSKYDPNFYASVIHFDIDATLVNEQGMQMLLELHSTLRTANICLYISLHIEIKNSIKLLTFLIQKKIFLLSHLIISIVPKSHTPFDNLIDKTEFELSFMTSLYRFLISFNTENIPITPFILRSRFSKNADQETLVQNFSIHTGSLLIDGIGDALYLQAPNLDPKENLELQLDLLQATRLRLHKTEYISCPSCGRTLFDLEETTKRIREKTSHLKGLKIAVMGCIVNGPGEMADADFGYVGAGPGKVHLYKEKELLLPNVPAESADEALVELIKKHGAWVEP